MTPIRNLFRRLLSADHRRLAGIIAFLKAENRILRARLPGEIHTRPTERFILLRHGKPLGGAVRDLLTTVDYRTYLHWVATGGFPQRRPPGRPGRPTVARAILDTATRSGRETSLGCGMILRELRRLGHRAVCRLPPDGRVHPAPSRHPTRAGSS